VSEGPDRGLSKIDLTIHTVAIVNSYLADPTLTDWYRCLIAGNTTKALHRPRPFCLTLQCLHPGVITHIFFRLNVDMRVYFEGYPERIRSTDPEKAGQFVSVSYQTTGEFLEVEGFMFLLSKPIAAVVNLF
jgi:hypothetical protein